MKEEKKCQHCGHEIKRKSQPWSNSKEECSNKECPGKKKNKGGGTGTGW